MFVIPLKAPTAGDIKTALTEWLASDNGPSDYSRDFQTLQNLRNSATSVTTHGCDNAERSLHQYFKALCNCEDAGFPIKDGESYGLVSKWKCAFEPNKELTRNNIRFERVSILFNIAALESHVAAMADRKTENGLKIACNKFQQAAGIFENLKSIEIADNPTADLSAAGLQMATQLMLAQAQSCVYEKAVGKKGSDKTKPSILAKISQATSEFYSDALVAAQDKAMNGKLDDTWEINLKSQKLCFAAAANYWEAINLGEVAKATGSGYGVEIARLSEAENFAEQAIVYGKKNSLNVDSPDSLKRLILQRRTEAIKDNEEIYMEPVPAPQKLAAIRPVKVVKALPLPPTLVAEPNLFKGILPKQGKSALDQYNTAVQESVNLTGDLVVSANDYSRNKLQALKLPQSLEEHLAGDALPNESWAKIESIQQTQLQARQPSLRDLLKSKKNEVEVASQRCNGLIEATGEMLVEHQRLDNEFRAENPKFVGSEQQNLGQLQSDVRRDMAHYTHLLENASKSDFVQN